MQPRALADVQESEGGEDERVRAADGRVLDRRLHRHHAANGARAEEDVARARSLDDLGHERTQLRCPVVKVMRDGSAGRVGSARERFVAHSEADEVHCVDVVAARRSGECRARAAAHDG